MKLLLTLDFPPERGGVQRYLFDKVVHAYGPGDAVMVGSGRSRDAFPGLTMPCPVSWHANRLSPLNRKWSVVNFLFVLVFRHRKYPALVIECGNVYAAIAPFIVSFFRPLRYRVYAYGGELLCLRRRRTNLKRLLFRAILLRAETLSVIGTYVLQLLRDAGITTAVTVDPPRITLSGNGPGTKRPGSGSGTHRLLSVGRFVPHKGHDVLLEAVSLLTDDCKWRLVLAGSGPEEERLRTIVAARKLSDRVIIKTGLDDAALASEYQNADLFIMPSIETVDGAEGFGIVLLEAAAQGVPIVASRVGGVPEVLDGGACGMLVEPGNPDALSSAIRSLALDEGLRKQLAAKAFARVREHYAW